jgi:hypothetical protein
MSDKFTPARASNAKAKVIEPYFLSINKKYCQMMPNWSGFGATSLKKNQPNVDLLNKYHHNFPDKEGCIRQIEGIIAMERASKINRYKELWDKTPEEHKLPLSFEQFLFWFGCETGEKNMLQGTGLKVSIEGVKHDYDCFDMRMRDHEAIRWTIKYDPADTSKILAINDDGTLRFGMEEKYVQPMALKERKEGDYKELERVNDFNHILVESITEKRKISATAVGEFFEENPALQDTLAKMLIVDSRGQHKDQRNASLGKVSTQKPKKLAAPIFEDQADDDTDISKMI